MNADRNTDQNDQNAQTLTSSTTLHPCPSASIRGSLPLEEQTSAIIGAAIEVLNTLGHGLLEKSYENALRVELQLCGLTVRQQCPFQVVYKGVNVGDYVPDLIAGDVVIEAKTIDRITDHELGQVINYLKITRLPVGLILNFKRARLEWKRVVNTQTTDERR